MERGELGEVNKANQCLLFHTKELSMGGKKRNLGQMKAPNWIFVLENTTFLL